MWQASDSRLLLGVAFVISLLVHLGLALGLEHLPTSRPEARRPIEVAIVEKRREPPPEPLEPPEPLKSEPPPSPPKIERARVPEAMPRPPEVTAPQPSEPVGQTTEEKIAGLSADSFAVGEGANLPVAGAGNTLMAQPLEHPVAVAEVLPYRAPLEVAQVDRKPKLLFTPDSRDVFEGLDYPPDAKANKVQGEVRVNILIDEKGEVREVKAVKGPLELRGPAEALARRYRYRPALKAGEPVSCRVSEVITFQITD